MPWSPVAAVIGALSDAVQGDSYQQQLGSGQPLRVPNNPAGAASVRADTLYGAAAAYNSQFPAKPELADELLEICNVVAGYNSELDQWILVRKRYSINTDTLGKIRADRKGFLIESVAVAADAELDIWRAAIQTLLTNKNTGGFQ